MKTAVTHMSTVVAEGVVSNVGWAKPIPGPGHDEVMAASASFIGPETFPDTKEVGWESPAPF